MSSVPQTAPAGPRPPLIELGAAGVMVVAAALSFTPVFAGGAVVALVLAAVAPVALTAVVAEVWRAPRPARLAAGLVTWALLAAVTAYGGAGGLASLVGGLRDGAHRLLTTALPADAAGDELAAVLLVVWAASTATCELVLARREGLLPALPTVLLLGAALVAGAGGRPMPAAVPALVVAGVALFALVRNGWRTGRSHSRLVVGGAVTAVVAVVATAVGPHLPGAAARPRFDPRSAYDPLVTRPAVSPLVGFAASLTAGDETVFSVRAGPGVQQWRLTTLDRFDGRLWTTAAAFRRAGRVLPPDPDVEVGTEDFEQDVHIERLEGYFLPAAGRPARVSVPGLAVDPESGTLLVPADRPPPRRYTVVSKLARRSPVQLRLAEAVPLASDDSVPPPPPLPADLRRLAEQVTRDSASAFGKMAALQHHFRGGGYSYDSSSQAPSGHSLFHIGELVRKRRGTAEQYASAFAVLALSLGYQARVAVGYGAGRRDPSMSTYRVRAADLHAWPEVRFEGVGWVPFEPSPLDQLRSDPQQELPAPLPAVERAVRDEMASAGSERGRGQREPTPRRDGERAAPWLAVLAVAALSLAVLVPSATVAAKAARRRRRLRASAPRARVLGAWEEVVDRLRERRVRVSAAMTADEVVAAAATSLGPEAPAALARLAAAADHALFAPGPPDAATSDAAWAWARQVRADLGRGVSWWRRPVLALSPAPLLPP